MAGIEKAHLLPGSLAPTLFVVALPRSLPVSTATATLASRIVSEGFINLRIAPWAWRLVARRLAIIPATVVILLCDGEAIPESSEFPPWRLA